MSKRGALRYHPCEVYWRKMLGIRVRPGKLLFLLAALMPIVALPILMPLGVDVFARSGATLLRSWALRLPVSIAFAGELPFELDVPLASANTMIMSESARRGSVVRAEVRPRADERRNGPAGRKVVRRIYIGPSLVRRAVPASGRPSAAWTTSANGAASCQRSDEHPAGLLITNPGALAGTIEEGDVLCEAEGRSLTSFEALVSIVSRRYEQGAKIVSGRLWRRGEIWTITVEPGWITESPRSGQ